MYCGTPFASVAAASARPPPNRISTPQGSFCAVAQSIARTPFARSTGIRNSAMAARIAMPASESPASGRDAADGPVDEQRGVIHSSTVTANTASVTRSPALRGPSSPTRRGRTRGRPRSRAMREGNITVVFRSQASGRNTSIAGTPTAIHSRKPMRMPEVCST